MVIFTKKSVYPLITLYYREVFRFYKVLFQTVLTPLVNATLYLFIFGVSLGSHIELGLGGLSYLSFLIPGLVMMSVLNNSFQNSSSSIISGKFVGDLEDWRVAPLSPQSILWALSLGGLTRGGLVALMTFCVGELFFYGFHGEFLNPVHPFFLIVFLIIGGLSFALFGISVAFWARSIDHMNAVGSFVLLPLIYLGGVFFPLHGLHVFWQWVSRFNPLFYFINGVRYSLLGISDVSLSTALIVSGGAFAFFYTLALLVLNRSSFLRW